MVKRVRDLENSIPNLKKLEKDFRSHLERVESANTVIESCVLKNDLESKLFTFRNETHNAQ